MKRSVSIFTIFCATAVALVCAGGARRDSFDVSIERNAFKPATVEVSVGDKVVWTNNDNRDHTVSAKDGSFRSGNIKPGKTFEFRFNKAGTFEYGCDYIPRMKGKVVVE